MIGIDLTRMQETAARFNDHALLIDETGAAELPKDKLYDLMRRVTYAYAEGAESTRHSKSGYAQTKEQSDAKGIMITTSEHSLDALATLARKARDGGEVARAFNVPATCDDNVTIFDIWPSNIQQASRKEWAVRKFAALRTGCPLQHGTAFEHYMDFLTGQGREGLVSEVRQDMSEFDRELVLKSDDRWLHHAAKNFSLVYAGGVQAINAELLPIKKQQLLRSIVKCFNDGLAAIAPPRELEVNAKKQLLNGLRLANLPEKSELDDKGDFVGFQRPFSTEDARVMFAIKPAVFSDWFADDALAQAALRWLSMQELLLMREGARLTDGPISMEAVVTFEKRSLGNGKRGNGRWLRFLDPRSAAKNSG